MIRSDEINIESMSDLLYTSIEWYPLIRGHDTILALITPCQSQDEPKESFACLKSTTGDGIICYLRTIAAGDGSGLDSKPADVTQAGPFCT